ncbi:MAG: cobalt-precorrin-6A reductase [Pseudomonadota bacterium]
MRLLILGGTGEARVLAERVARWETISATLSLAGATRQPNRSPLPTRVGGFGGGPAFADWLRNDGTEAIIDATHPFAARISNRTASIAQELGVPLVQILRPLWQPEPGDIWHRVAQEEDVAALIPKDATVFLATGRQTLSRFSGLSGRRIFCRQIDPPEQDFPYPGGAYVVGRPPFSVAQEEATFRDLGIDWLVVKNSGGAASRSKLDAARHLGLPVAMLERPPQPDCPRVETVEEALEWLSVLAAGARPKE